MSAFQADPLRPNTERARTVVVLAWIGLGIYGAGFIIDLGFFLTAKDYFYATQEGLMIMGVYSLMSLVSSIALPIFFIMWMRRAYANLHRAGVRDLTYSEGWAAGAWFVPIMNLFRPYVIMKEIHVRTQSAFRKESDYVVSSHAHIKNWWITYWLIAFLGGLSGSLSRNGKVEGGLLVAGLSSLISVYNLYLLVHIVRDISSMETEFSERVLRTHDENVAALARKYHA